MEMNEGMVDLVGWRHTDSQLNGDLEALHMTRPFPTS